MKVYLKLVEYAVIVVLMGVAFSLPGNTGIALVAKVFIFPALVVAVGQLFHHLLRRRTDTGRGEGVSDEFSSVSKKVMELTRFAEDRNLPEKVIYVFNQLRHYPEWSGEEVLSEMVCPSVTAFEQSDENGDEFLFEYGERQWAMQKRRECSKERIRLQVGGDIVFSVTLNCEAEHLDDISVNGFVKGEWVGTFEALYQEIISWDSRIEDAFNDTWKALKMKRMKNDFGLD